MHISLTLRSAWIVTGLVIALIGLLRLAEAAPASADEPLPFGITNFTLQTTEPTEELEVTRQGHTGHEFINRPYPFTQAGGHPWALTTTLEFTTRELEFENQGILVQPTQQVKDIVVNLPPGLVGDPLAAPRCSLAVLGSGGRCPADTQIGVWHVYKGADNEDIAPIVNVTPEAGQWPSSRSRIKRRCRPRC